MRTLKLILLAFTLSSAMLVDTVTAQSGQTQKRDTPARKKTTIVGQDSMSKKNSDKDVNKKRTHKKNVKEEKTEKK